MDRMFIYGILLQMKIGNSALVVVLERGTIFVGPFRNHQVKQYMYQYSVYWNEFGPTIFIHHRLCCIAYAS